MSIPRGAGTLALLAIFCTLLPCVSAVISDLQGQRVAWRDPRVAMIQNIIVMESTGIFERPDVLMNRSGLPVYGLNLSQCSFDFRDPWSEIDTIFSHTAGASTVPIIGGALFHDYYSYYTFGYGALQATIVYKLKCV